MRAKSVVHVEYEVFKRILDSEIIAETLEDIRMDLVPSNDSVAEKRFDEGVKSASQYILNLLERRRHRLPEEHEDFQVKG